MKSASTATWDIINNFRRLKLGKYYSADAKGRTFQGKNQVIVRYLKNGCENEVVTPVADGYAGVNLFSVQQALKIKETKDGKNLGSSTRNSSV